MKRRRQTHDHDRPSNLELQLDLEFTPDSHSTPLPFLGEGKYVNETSFILDKQVQRYAGGFCHKSFN